MKTVQRKKAGTLKKAVILLSGGMDSATLLYHLRKTLKYRRIYAITFAYRQKHLRELDCAAWQALAAGVEEHVVVDLSFFRSLVAGSSILTDPQAKIPDLSAIKPAQRDQPPTYVPHRNLLFLTLAAAYAEAKGVREIYYGAQKQDSYGYWDCTPGFLKRLNRVLALDRRKAVTCYAPFISLSKTAELKIGLTLGVDYAHTWSCYRGQSKACGTCPSCVERLAAFRRAGVQDPLNYSRIK